MGIPRMARRRRPQRISAQDLRAFHRRYYQPANSILAVVGDITAKDAMALADQVFLPDGKWQQARCAALVAPAPSGKRRVVAIDKSDAVQTEIRIGSPGRAAR